MLRWNQRSFFLAAWPGRAAPCAPNHNGNDLNFLPNSNGTDGVKRSFSLIKAMQKTMPTKFRFICSGNVSR
jgi:hypothetical protein